MPWWAGGNANGSESETPPVSAWTDAIMTSIYEILRSLEFAIGGIEIFINTTEFMQEWNNGDYF